MKRRDLLKNLLATTIASATPGYLFADQHSTATAVKQTKYPWRNWSGNQQCFPASRKAPSTVAELQELVRQHQGVIRPVGAGHSFSALIPTDDTLISLRSLSGLKSVNGNNATFYPGTILSEIGPALAEHNQALINMPDIDQQTIAGAIATATHGTGRQLGSLSAYVSELEIVTANGDLIQCSENNNRDMYKAAQVGLGALGIVSAVTMRNRDVFKLKREAAWLEFDQMLSEAHQLSKENRNFEFFYFPFTGMALMDRLNITEEPISEHEELDGNSGLMDLKHARDYLSWSNKLRELILSSYMKTIEPSANIDYSYSIYATERNVRFNEMEYHLPAEIGLQALAEIKQIVESNFPEVFFPIECRFIQADDIWLSPFYQRETISIAVHRYFEEDFSPLFAAIEPVFKKYEGRPHWGKWNSLTAQEFAALYPHWNDFKEIRKELDPKGKFMNPYLRDLMG